YEQLSLSVRNLELRGCLLSGFGLRRLARPERLWTAVQGRTKPGYSFVGELALRGNIQARPAKAKHDRRMGDGRVPALGGRRWGWQSQVDCAGTYAVSHALSAH